MSLFYSPKCFVKGLHSVSESRKWHVFCVARTFEMKIWLKV